jgi:hypothetical protein
MNILNMLRIMQCSSFTLTQNITNASKYIFIEFNVDLGMIGKNGETHIWNLKSVLEF